MEWSVSAVGTGRLAEWKDERGMLSTSEVTDRSDSRQGRTTEIIHFLVAGAIATGKTGQLAHSIITPSAAN